MSFGRAAENAMSPRSRSTGRRPLGREERSALECCRMADPQPNFSVVIVGTMNPAIHHPFWYEMIGVLSKDERDEAIQSPQLLLAPMVGQFSWSGWTIVCMPERWEMRTADAAKFDRIVDVASKVFDRLADTPVTAFGINIDYVTPKDGATAALTRALHNAKIGVGPDASDATFTTRWQVRREHTVLSKQVTVSTTAAEPSVLRIANNFQHDMALVGFQDFNLSDFLREGFTEAVTTSQKQAADIVASFPWGAH
jgi:hypothetical protein